MIEKHDEIILTVCSVVLSIGFVQMYCFNLISAWNHIENPSCVEYLVSTGEQKNFKIKFDHKK